MRKLLATSRSLCRVLQGPFSRIPLAESFWDAPLVPACWDTFQKATHRADASRYSAMFFLGGICLDIKTLVLKDLQNLLIEKQRELDRMTGGVNMPFFLSAIGRACDHVFQGCLVLPRYHPLVA